MMNIKPFNVTKSNLPMLIAKLQDLLEFQPEKNWQVLIKERADSRSIEQNARLWSLYTSIGNYLGYTAEEIHQLFGFKFLLEEKWIGKDKITRVKSTTKLSVKDMAEYQDKICAYAGNLGWSDDSGF
jgi:hypothetical protein